MTGAEWYLLVNGLKKFSLVLPDSGVVHLPHQFGVLIDEPRLPENIRSCVFHLSAKKGKHLSDCDIKSKETYSARFQVHHFILGYY